MGASNSKPATERLLRALPSGVVEPAIVPLGRDEEDEAVNVLTLAMAGTATTDPEWALNWALGDENKGYDESTLERRRAHHFDIW